MSLNIAILAGQEKTRTLRSDSAITVLASDDFWHRISGIPDFRARLLRASTILAWLIKARSRDEVERIKGEAREVYGNDDGRINLDALASVGRQPSRAAIESDLLDT